MMTHWKKNPRKININFEVLRPMIRFKQKNIIILNLKPLSKQPNRLKTIVSQLKTNSSKINGDIALLSQETLILTPENVKIIKSKPKKR